MNLQPCNAATGCDYPAGECAGLCMPKPEALRLAERFENEYCDGMARAAAKELRRLHAVNADLLDALNRIRSLPVTRDAMRMAHFRADTAIANATKEAA